jgi:hypothetical protein
VVGDYSLEDFAPGKDRITLVFKSAGGRTWEPQELLLEKAKGRVIFEVGGDQILKQPSLVRPLQILLVIDRQEAPEKVRSLRASETVVLSADPAKANQARLEEARLLPPHIGKGQLLSDVANDPRVKPTLPMALNRAGNKVWGIYKVLRRQRWRRLRREDAEERPFPRRRELDGPHPPIPAQALQHQRRGRPLLLPTAAGSPRPPPSSSRLAPLGDALRGFLRTSLGPTPESTSALIPSDSPTFTSRFSNWLGATWTSTKRLGPSKTSRPSLMASTLSRRARTMLALAL